MNKKPIRLFCRSSSCTSNGAHAIFSWRAAIKHFDDYNHCLEGKLDLNLAVATPEETEQIAPLEADYLKPVQSQPNLLYYCAHCPEKLWSGDKPLIKKHLQDSHDIKSLSACDVILHGSAICPTRVFWLIDYKAAAKSNREVRRMLSCNPRSSRKGQVWATVGVLNAS